MFWNEFLHWTSTKISFGLRSFWQPSWWLTVAKPIANLLLAAFFLISRLLFLDLSRGNFCFCQDKVGSSSAKVDAGWWCFKSSPDRPKPGSKTGFGATASAIDSGAAVPQGCAHTLVIRTRHRHDKTDNGFRNSQGISSRLQVKIPRPLWIKRCLKIKAGGVDFGWEELLSSRYLPIFGPNPREVSPKNYRIFARSR